MSDQLDELHARAGLDLLHADSQLTVYDEQSPPTGSVGPYVRVYAHIEWPSGHSGNSLDGRSGACVTTWYCHCVGPNDTSARAVAMRCRAALLDQRPTIAGRNCSMITMASSLPPRADEQTGKLTVDAVVVFELTTTPA